MKKHSTSTTSNTLSIHKEVVALLNADMAFEAAANLVTTTSSTPLCIIFAD